MGQRTQAAIEAWQKASGIEPATGDRRKLLDEMSETAVELIKVIERERSGIRGGDGHWHGSDPLDGLVRRIAGLNTEERSTWFRTEDELIDHWRRARPDDEIPF